MSGPTQEGLFERTAPRPLADRLRPGSLDVVVGQDQVLGPDGPLCRMLAAGKLASMILWGPPGCGKTTIARLLATEVDLAFEPLFDEVVRLAPDLNSRRRDLNSGQADREASLELDNCARVNLGDGQGIGGHGQCRHQCACDPYGRKTTVHGFLLTR